MIYLIAGGFIVLSTVVLLTIKKTRKISKIKRNISKKDKKKEVESIGDIIFNLLMMLIKGISAMINRSKLFNKKSKKYEEFLKALDNDTLVGVDVISIKIVSSIMFLVIINSLYFLTSISTAGLPLLVILVIGYYLPNIYFFTIRYYHRKKLSDELRNTIVLWNNAYKAGKSTLQALETTIDSSPKFMATELKKLVTDMKKGLGIDEAFNRFKKRTGIEEIGYIAETIAISEATGGNIVKLFSRLEKNLIMKSKIKNEKAALSASSKITAIILIAMPIVFYLIISLLSPNYFDPLYNSVIGLTILAIIVIGYMLYIYLTVKILKISR